MRGQLSCDLVGEGIGVISGDVIEQFGQWCRRRVWGDLFEDFDESPYLG